MTTQYNVEALDAFDDQQLKELDWKNMTQLNGRLLDLHAEGELGNDKLAKLPLRPILCVDHIDLIDDTVIEGTFTFPENEKDWAFDSDESLEMLFQDQLDQLVGFWGARKVNGIGRALSSGACKLYQPLDFEAGKTVKYRLQKRKWMQNKDSEGGTAVFNGAIFDANDEVILETKNVIVGILRPQDINDLRQRYGGKKGVDNVGVIDAAWPPLRIPIYDKSTKTTESNAESEVSVCATQKINPDLWPLRFHFRGDPVVPGNFGTHGMIALLKETAREAFGVKDPVFKSMSKKTFSGMIFEDPKQICFELNDVTQDAEGQVIAKQANLYLEDESGKRMIEDPIYTFKNMKVGERG
ncbi:MAG TPA: hypothetical protein EYH16_01570 [Leucothrix mucor]|nr:hypothetical protein [Leucothrix mucor]